MMEYIETETRNSSLPDLVEMLQKYEKFSHRYGNLFH